jgi:hypothetical protein
VEDVPNGLTSADKEVLRAAARDGVRLGLSSVAPPAGFA